jgi:hypothetical protein
VKREDDHKENIGMLISFNYGQFILIRKYRVQIRYEILTYSATILTRYKTLGDGHIQPNHVMWKDDYGMRCI